MDPSDTRYKPARAVWVIAVGVMLLVGCSSGGTRSHKPAPVYHQYGHIAYGTDGSVVYLDQLRPQERQGRQIRGSDGRWSYVY